MNHYYNPVHTVQGKKSVEEIPELIKKGFPKGCRILLLAWDESIFQISPFNKLDFFENVTVCRRCFQASNPTVEQLFEIYEETAEFSPQMVIAIGGGSVMDVGKSLCCLYGREIPSVEALRTMIIEKDFGIPAAKWIGVPTTAGTGSEVTCWATIWDPSKDVKRSLESQENYAYAAVADPDLISQMPVKLAVSSALDAVAHAVESYWARQSNAISKELALGAVRIIMSHMDSLLSGEKEAFDSMSQGSMMAGMAFSNTKTTACHSISYPLTMHYHIPHGTAVSMLLAPVMKINQEKTEDMEKLLAALGVKDAEALEIRIKEILKKAGIPLSLEDWRVEKKDLKELASLGITKGRADNNPVDLSADTIEKILESIYAA